MSNYSKFSIPDEPRVELHDALNLTGAEISVNTMAAGTSVPFVHEHKSNEEIYGILSGSGNFVIDGETIPVTAGDWLRVAPQAKRRLSADADSVLVYICIQVKAGSLDGYTMTDAVIC